jgi:alpha-mannosidase
VTSFRELLTLLPCSSWEDLSTSCRGEEAEGLLAAWSALWHPRLLAAAGSTPAWHGAEDPPEDVTDALVIIPPVSESLVSVAWMDRAEGDAVAVIRGIVQRDRLLAAALGHLDAMASSADTQVADPASLDADLVADFLALGFGYLMVESLTQEMHSASYMDHDRFGELLPEAARAAVGGDQEKAREGLSGLFDLLLEARDHHYPVDAYLIDLTLIAPTTLGRGLQDELAAVARFGTPANLVMSAETVERMAARQPDSLAVIREGVQGDTLAVLGGLDADEPEPQWTPEQLLDSILRARRIYTDHLGAAVTFYASRAAALWPTLPAILSRCGFDGALHMALDGSKIPRPEQCKIRWEGLDGSTLDALATVPLDARQAESFLEFSHRMSHSMDRDYVATICLAHWPGQASCWYDDLRRVARYAPVLGRFMTLADYFSTTQTPDLVSQFEPDQYHFRGLTEEVAAGTKDPISRHARAERRRNDVAAARAIEAMTALAGRPSDHSAACEDSPPPLRDALSSLAGQLAQGQNAAPQGTLAVNPWSHPRVVHGAALSADIRPPAGPGASLSGGSMTDVPALGFAWLGPVGSDASEAGRGRGSADAPVADGHVLRNEFFEITVSPRSGGIQAVHEYDRRGNQLSQQIAFHNGTAQVDSPGAEDPAGGSYSRMVASSVEVTAGGSITGEITSEGQLLDGAGQRLAGYRQITRLSRGSRIVELEIELQPDRLPQGDPWSDYYALRVAWPDEFAELGRSLMMMRHATTRSHFQAAQFVTVQSGGRSLVILPGGLPYHRTSGPRMLDTLLVVRGESARRFSLSLGIGIDHPMSAACDLLAPPGAFCVGAAQPASGSAGWLLHVDQRRVVVTHLEPIWPAADGSEVEEPAKAHPPSGATGRTATGFRLRLLETEGRSGRVRVSTFRPVREAIQTDFLGHTLAALPIDENGIMVDLSPYEWVQMEAEW